MLVVCGGALTVWLSPPASGPDGSEDRRPPGAPALPAVGPSRGADFGWCDTPEPDPLRTTAPPGSGAPSPAGSQPAAPDFSTAPEPHPTGPGAVDIACL